MANGGRAEVDVLAVRKDEQPFHKILVECKHWNRPVERSIVQSFKMDVLESGANFGVIITKTGYQKGAYKGAPLTTVRLYTFEEFQTAFAPAWSVADMLPLVEPHNLLVDLSRRFETGSVEAEAFDDALQSLGLEVHRNAVEFSTRMAIGLFRDYFQDFRDGLTRAKTPIEHYRRDPHTGQIRHIYRFHDSRTLRHVLSDAQAHAFAAWRGFYWAQRAVRARKARSGG